MAAGIVDAHSQRIGERLTGYLNELAVTLVLDHRGACFGNGKPYVFNLVNREAQAIGDRRGRKARERHPFGPRWNSKFDDLRNGVLDGLVHTRAFIAASSFS